MVRIRLLLVLVAISGVLLLASPGCDELVTETIEITIAGHPTAEFRIVDTGILGDSGCLNNGVFQVFFEDISSGPVIRWMWDFGDSAIDTLYRDSGDNGNVSHTYTRIGSFTVTLSVFDSLDGSGLRTKNRAVIVGHSIDSMTLSDVSICPGDSVTFTAHNPFGVTSWRWDFSDGPVSLDSAPVQTHTYANSGLYEVSLDVSGACGQTLLIDTVQVMQCAAPYFTVDINEGCAPLMVQFTDSTPAAIIDTTTSEIIGNVVSWLFDFGVGTPQFYDYAPNVIDVEYDTAGVYVVTLTVETDSGGVTTYTDTIIVHPGDARFTAQPVISCQMPGRQFVVAFRRELAGDTAWLWDFGDGDTSHAQNPYHAYTNPGTYDVSLVAYGACGTDSVVFDSAAIVTYSDPLAATEIMVVPDPSISYLVHFVDVSPAAAVVDRIWDFGDSTVNPSAISTSHQYADTVRSYTVTLTRFNLCDSLTYDTLIDVDSVGGAR